MVLCIVKYRPKHKNGGQMHHKNIRMEVKKQLKSNHPHWNKPITANDGWIKTTHCNYWADKQSFILLQSI